MPYAILRFQKRKAGSVAACERHNERKREAYKSTPDIDMERSGENYHLVAPPRYTYKKEIKPHDGGGGVPGAPGQCDAGGKASFTDVPANADYAQVVPWAVENKITSGTGGGNFSPAATCTRGQIVTFLYRAMGQ